ncbi:MAG: hypothetical protein ACF8PN_04030 [Phycisphaerales bacterium]
MRRVLSCLAVVAASFLFSNPASGQTLTVTGPCPGVRTFSVTGLTPVVRVYFFRAFGTGSVVIPPGNLCAGTTLGLNNTVIVVGFIPSDAFGNATTTAFVPGWACGTVYVQAIDGANCNTSNVVLL